MNVDTLRPAHLRSLLDIDKQEGFISLVQTTHGRLLLFLPGLLLVQLAGHKWQTALAYFAAGLYAYIPAYRPYILFVATWLISLTFLPHKAASFLFATLYVLFAFCSLYYVRRFNSHPYARHPALILICTTLMISIGAFYLPLGDTRNQAWTVILIFKGYIWFLAYAIHDQRSRDRSPDLIQLGLFHPFWGSTNVPFGKGAAFLRRHWSSTPRELAITQLKGLKLFAWAIVLRLMEFAFSKIFITKLGIPSPDTAISEFLGHHPYPLMFNWASITLDVTIDALRLAASGHQIIGLARIAGFRLPRNTYRPLSSRTLAEFWNRYYFYFKELLVEFFYIPTFMKTFRNYPRLRFFFATFMSAGIGNAIYHFISKIVRVSDVGPFVAMKSFSSYFFYCGILATGIGISQLRANAGFRPSSTVPGRIRSFVTVWLFVVLLHIFGDHNHLRPLSDNLSFTASLFGMK